MKKKISQLFLCFQIRLWETNRDGLVGSQVGAHVKRIDQAGNETKVHIQILLISSFYTTPVFSQRAGVALFWKCNHLHLSGVVYKSSRRDNSQCPRCAMPQLMNWAPRKYCPEWSKTPPGPQILKMGKLKITGKAGLDRASPQVLGGAHSVVLHLPPFSPPNRITFLPLWFSR